jgi:hypothetical protein
MESVKGIPHVELDPVLQAALQLTPLGLAIKHPFVNAVPYAPPFAALYNEQLLQKRNILATAIASGEWHTAVFVHERPWRIDALVAIADRMSDAEYWELVRETWMDAENIPECRAVWDRVLRAPRADREHLTDSTDREELAILPDVVTLFQGRTNARDDGWSWTLDRAVGEWFANRFAMFENAKPVLASVEVPKVLISALLLGRNEREVLVDPLLIGNVTTIAL